MAADVDGLGALWSFLTSGISLGDKYHRLWITAILYVTAAALFAILLRRLALDSRDKSGAVYLQDPLPAPRPTLRFLVELFKKIIFLDLEGIKNIPSIKIKLMARSVWLLFQVELLVFMTVLFVYDGRDIYKIHFALLATLLPIYNHLSLMHWRRWSYCANLMNEAIPEEDSKRRNYRFSVAALHILSHDMWANKTFSFFVRQYLTYAIRLQFRVTDPPGSQHDPVQAELLHYEISRLEQGTMTESEARVYLRTLKGHNERLLMQVEGDPADPFKSYRGVKFR